MILLTDEEIHVPNLNKGYKDGFEKGLIDGRKESLKKVVEWGNEWCPVHTIEISKDVTEVIAKHQCCECWQALLKEVE